jgi:hypothetical protein
MESEWNQEVIARIAVAMVVCTLLLTTAFIGLVGLLQGELGAVNQRVPGYLVAASVIFAATIILLELNNFDGKSIISAAIFTGFLSFWLFLFGVEGLLFGIKNTDQILNQNLIFYFFAAALFATSLGFWGVKHWREFVSGKSSSL